MREWLPVSPTAVAVVAVVGAVNFAIMGHLREVLMAGLAKLMQVPPPPPMLPLAYTAAAGFAVLAAATPLLFVGWWWLLPAVPATWVGFGAGYLWSERTREVEMVWVMQFRKGVLRQR